MRVIVSSLGEALESALDQRFGRAACFLLVDTENQQFEVISNAGQSSTGGAGIAAAQSVVNSGAQVVITGQIGPNALEVLKSAELELFQGIPGSVLDNIEALKQNKLNSISSSGPAHAGTRH